MILQAAQYQCLIALCVPTTRYNVITSCSNADIALMHFFGALDSNTSIPNRSLLRPRTDDRSNRTCRTIGAFAVYMHDFGLSKFDSRFRDDQACWNGTFANDSSLSTMCGSSIDRHYTWWCNKRPNNPCVFNCPNQVSAYILTPFRNGSALNATAVAAKCVGQGRMAEVATAAVPHCS